MNLYLLRHGIAVEPGTHGFTSDEDRPLTPEGRRKLEIIARAMRAMDLSYGLVLSSPYLRARETTEIITKALHLRTEVQFSDALVPSASPAKIISLIHHLAPPPADLLLVGHEPCLSKLISFLVCRKSGGAFVMKKGGLCKLSTESLQAGACAALDWLLTPKQMALMG
jgi:phosphohistidine phosphatase